MRFRNLGLIFLILLCFMTNQVLSQGTPNQNPSSQEPSLEEGQTQTAPSKEAEKGKEDENSFAINFKDVPMEQIIKTFADITGKDFILEKMPEGKITILSPRKIPKAQALSVFEAILNLNGYNLSATSIPNLYRIVPVSESVRANIPIYFPEEKAPQKSESYIIRFVPLDYMDVQVAAQAVQSLLSKEGASAIPYQPTNTLIIVDTAINIDRIVKILKVLDVPSLKPEIEIYNCVYASATELSNSLQQIFADSGLGAKGGATAVARGGAAGSAGQISGTAAQAPNIKIIPDIRLNALILIGDRQSIDDAKKIIKMLDVVSGEKGVVHVYYCRNANAVELASTLAALGAGGTGAVRPATARTAEARQPGGETPRVSAGATATSISGGLFEGEIRITADEPTNSLLIIASPRDYETLKKVIDKLDIPRRQVFVEAALIEVSISEGKNLGTSIHGASGLKNEGAVFAGTSVGGLSSIALMSLLAQGIQLPSGITVGALGHPIVIPGTSVEVPSTGALIQMLASDSNINVLSTPTILTTDNKQAEINVGERRGFPTGQTVATGGLSSVTIQRETVGIKMKITPQICESGTIRMDISTEISSILPEAQVNVSQFGYTTSVKSAQTSVIVKDAQTIVIGGLMKDDRNQNIQRVPLLGDIPLFGWLFKQESRNKAKTNLIILLTPHIVRTDEEIARVREKFRKGYEDFIEETLGTGAEDWSKYFESQYDKIFLKKEPQTDVQILDFTGEKPKAVEPEEKKAPSEPTKEKEKPLIITPQEKQVPEEEKAPENLMLEPIIPEEQKGETASPETQEGIKEQGEKQQ